MDVDKDCVSYDYTPTTFDFIKSVPAKVKKKEEIDDIGIWDEEDDKWYEHWISREDKEEEE